MNILFYNNYCFFLNITICLGIVNVPIKSVVLFLYFQPIRIHLCIDNQSRQYFPVKEVECVQPSYNRIHVVLSFILINQSLQRLFGVKESERYIYILDDFMVQWERMRCERLDLKLVVKNSSKILNNQQRSSFEQSLKDTNSMPQKKTTQML